MNSGSDIYRILFNKLDLNKMREGFVSEYTVTLDGNSGVFSSSATPSATTITLTNQTSPYTLPTGSGANIPTRLNYVFSGWSETSNGNIITTTTIILTGNKIFYAIWTPTYVVTFDKNGSETGSNTTQNVVSGGTPIFPRQGLLTKTGYTFEGWSLYANGTGTVYENGASYTVTQATTFYAVWAVTGPRGDPGPTGSPGPRGPVGYSNIEYALIDNENNYLQKEIDSLINSTSKNARSNTYFSEDKMLMIYLNRMLFIVYIVVYFAFLYSLYLNRQTTGTIVTVIIALVFLLLPYAIDAISKFMHDKFINIMRIFYKGNAFFLHEPPKKTDTL